MENVVIAYVNGGTQVQTGVIVKVTGSNLLVLNPDNKAQLELYNAGYNVGDCIKPEQIKGVLIIC